MGTMKTTNLTAKSSQYIAPDKFHYPVGFPIIYLSDFSTEVRRRFCNSVQALRTVCVKFAHFLFSPSNTILSLKQILTMAQFNILLTFIHHINTGFTK